MELLFTDFIGKGWRKCRIMDPDEIDFLKLSLNESLNHINSTE
ncbi:hypothetical protein [Methanosarcina sp.]|jgi:hypothetical protein|nr:hypothetical protein [Methanosarcina sp.]MDW5550068.1 hypothetical protein [Methanosarcina sp.]MDW5554022.1 hypothetical protein [Methanosarcina sp.]MDW5558473.1 hypothetical protein [Methanosarcina sp.]